MAENSRAAKVLLAYQVAGQRAAINSAKDVEAALGRVKGATASTELTAKRLQTEIAAIGRGREIDAIARDFATAATNGQDLERVTARTVERLRALGSTEAEIRKVARAYDQAEKEAREFAQAASAPATPAVASGAGPAGGTLTRIGTSLRNLPSMPIPGAGGLATDAVGNILRLTGAMTTAAGGLSTLLTAAVPLGAVVGGIALVMGEASKASEEARKRIEAFGQALGDVATRAAGGATTRQLQEELAQRQRDQASLEEQIDKLNALRDQANQLAASVRLSSSGSPLNTPELAALEAVNEEIRTLTGGQIENFSQLGGVIESLQGKTKDVSAEIGAINVLLGSTAVAANDAAEAERQLAEARRQTILATADEARQNALENARFAGMSSDQLQTERDRLQADSRATREALRSIINDAGIDVAALDGVLTRTGATGQRANDIIRMLLSSQGVDSGVIDAFIAYREQLRLNQDDVNRLTQTYIPLATRTEATAAANEKAAAALEDMVGAALKVSEQAAKNREAVADFQALQARAATEIAQAEQRVDDAIAKGEQQRLDILQKANDQAAKIGEDYGITRVRAEEDLRRELARIERRARGEQLDAIGERDALAFLQSQRKAKAEADEAKEQASVESRRRREDYERRIRDLAQATSRELQLNRQRTNDAVNAARAALEVERQKWSAEINMRQQALNTMLQQYNIFLSQLRAAQAAAQRQVIQPVTYQIPQTGNAYQDYVNYQRSQGIPGFASGLERVPHDNFIARLHKDERVLTASEAREQDRARLFSGASGGSRAGFSGPVSLRLSIDGPALGKLIDGRAVNVMAEVLD